MISNLSQNSPYSYLALGIIIGFYLIYFGKMFLQKKKGITTNQIGRRQEPVLHTVETLMKTATYAIVPVQLLSILLAWTHLAAIWRNLGFLLGLSGDLIFLASVICMRDSWRAGIPENEQTKLITTGIYKFSRNPAFLGFDLMYIGILLLYFNIFTLIFTAFAIIMLHLQILQEEKYLPHAFGDSYLSYTNHVRRYFGRKF